MTDLIHGHDATAGDARSAGSWIEFDIHGRAAVRVDAEAPTAPLLRDMLGPFLSRSLPGHDLTVTGQAMPMAAPSHAEHEYRYTDSGVYLDELKVQILVDGDGFRLSGTRELLTSALPLIDRILVRRGAAMIHAATFSYRGHGVAMPAWGGVGKTSTMAKLLRLDDVAFMGDDWAFMTADGELLGYCKPMFIKPHHRPIYPHLFERRRKPLVPKALSRPVAELTTLVHPLVTQYPRLAGFTRRWSPEHMMVRPQDALPHAAIATAAPLAVAVFVERFDGASAALEAVDTDWMVARLVGNFHAELARHSRDVITALGATGLVPLEQAFADKAAVLQAALAGRPVFLLRVPAAMPADQASDVIVEHLRHVFVAAGVE